MMHSTWWTAVKKLNFDVWLLRYDQNTKPFAAGCFTLLEAVNQAIRDTPFFGLSGCTVNNKQIGSKLYWPSAQIISMLDAK